MKFMEWMVSFIVVVVVQDKTEKEILLIIIHHQGHSLGLWCQWAPNKEGTAIGWDGNEKFYDYIEWIKYLIEKILKPNGYVLNGNVHWQGEDEGDRGVIEIINNKVNTAQII